VTWVKNNKLTSLLLFACIGFGLYFIYEIIRWVPYPNQIDYGEGLITYINNMWVTGTWKWDMTVPPYLPLMYGVGEPLISMPLINMFGNELWVGRLISVVSAFIIILMIYLIVKRLTSSKLWGLIGALLPLSQPIIRDWALMARVDILSVMFDMVGLYLFIRFRDSKHVYWSIIPFIFAILTKMTAIAALLAVLIYLLVNNRKVFLKFIGILVPVVGGSLLTIQVMSGGYYFEHVITASRTIDLIWTWAVIQTNWVGVMLPLVIFFALSTLYIKKGFGKWYIKLKSFDILGLFLICAFIIDFGSGLRPGGFINYYLEFIFATCLCAVMVIPKLFERAGSQYQGEEKTVGSYGLLIGVMFVLMAFVSTKTAFPFPNEQYDKDVEVVTEIISDTNEPVITENFGLVTNIGKDIYCEYFVITHWTQLGLWDDTNYLKDYESQKFDYIILRVPLSKRPENGDGHFPENIMNAIRENYTLVYEPEENF